ncbi:MAG: hypothetical protein Q7V56_09695 [Gammaproteobacteria bacterium]|nr:hypothetical protein [Gammaproteobacteria bacterium]
MEQPVMDWVGEMPILGKQFTYQLELDSARLPFPIRLLQVNLTKFAKAAIILGEVQT